MQHGLSRSSSLRTVCDPTSVHFLLLDDEPTAAFVMPIHAASPPDPPVVRRVGLVFCISVVARDGFRRLLIVVNEIGKPSYL